MIDRAGLADFLRTRREALQPEDVGLPRTARRRTNGLRREEVAALSLMSTDYYSRLEQQRGPQPSDQMLGSIARGLRLSLDERDHLFRLAGHAPPSRALRSDHVNPGLMRVLDRLQDTPAQIITGLGETLVQTGPARALFGDETQFDGLERSSIYRWFTGKRSIYLAEHHEKHGRIFVAQLRAVATRFPHDDRVRELIDTLLVRSQEFAAYWNDHQVGLRFNETKQFDHPEVGRLDLDCQMLLDVDQTQSLLVFTATPGSPSHEKLQLLAVSPA